jgi:lipid-binding SYLF domain-containing protein
MIDRRTLLSGFAAAPLLVTGCTVGTGAGGTAQEKATKRSTLDKEATTALAALEAASPAARALAPKAKGILVFPTITKGGFIVGGEGGDGVLRQGGRTTGFYSIGAASFGLQAGAQSFSQALFLMTDAAVKSLDKAGGFDVGAEGTVAIADVGKGGEVSAATLQSPIIAFIWGQQGLMGGLSLKGSKITRLEI